MERVAGIITYFGCCCHFLGGRGRDSTNGKLIEGGVRIFFLLILLFGRLR